MPAEKVVLRDKHSSYTRKPGGRSWRSINESENFTGRAVWRAKEADTVKKTPVIVLRHLGYLEEYDQRHHVAIETSSNGERIIVPAAEVYFQPKRHKFKKS